MGLTNTETTTVPFAPASFRAQRIRAAWPSWRAPIVGTSTTGRLAFARNSRADTGEFAILIARAKGGIKGPPAPESPQRAAWTQGCWRQPASSPDAPGTCAILTTRPNAMVAEIHDRMPVILAADAARRWIEPGSLPAELLVPYPAEEMQAWRVSDDAKSSRIEPHAGMAEAVEFSTSMKK